MCFYLICVLTGFKSGKICMEVVNETLHKICCSGAFWRCCFGHCLMLLGSVGGGGTPDTPHPQKTTDEATVKTVKDSLTVQETVGKGQTKITLPKGIAGVTVTWASNKSDVIDSDGNVTHKDGEGFDEVELTAKITKGEASAKKTFKVKVA